MAEESCSSFPECICPLEGIIEVISKKWALQIVCTVGKCETVRFSELQERLGDMNPKTLTNRLKELEKAGLIRRKAFAVIPPRVEYSLTEDGIALGKAIIPLMEWASRR
jgi:DNA-binding HxlR family transcriptional regulator